MSKPYFWPQDETNKIIQGYKAGGLAHAQSLLPGKSKGTIATKACRLGITNPRPRKK